MAPELHRRYCHADSGEHGIVVDVTGDLVHLDVVPMSPGAARTRRVGCMRQSFDATWRPVGEVQRLTVHEQLARRVGRMVEITTTAGARYRGIVRRIVSRPNPLGRGQQAVVILGDTRRWERRPGKWVTYFPATTHVVDGIREVGE